MKKMQELQPKLKAIQKKYPKKDVQTKQKMQQETMALYKEAGVNPIGCLGPLIIQMPIWIGLYRAILKTSPSTPEGFVDLSKYFYSWNASISKIPFNNYLKMELNLRPSKVQQFLIDSYYKLDQTIYGLIAIGALLIS